MCVSACACGGGVGGGWRWRRCWCPAPQLPISPPLPRAAPPRLAPRALPHPSAPRCSTVTAAAAAPGDHQPSDQRVSHGAGHHPRRPAAHDLPLHQPGRARPRRRGAGHWRRYSYQGVFWGADGWCVRVLCVRGMGVRVWRVLVGPCMLPSPLAPTAAAHLPPLTPALPVPRCGTALRY